VARFNWRAWNTALHRDLGYLAVGLTLVYAVSGLVVNHRDDFNSNYSFERVEKRFEPIPVSDRDTMVAQLVERLRLPGPPKNAFRPRPEEVHLFYDGWSVEADAVRGVALVEEPRERPFLRDANFLHLNEPRGAWTFVADAYALVLLFLAGSGLLMIRGKKGFLGRGKWFVSVGVLGPLLYLLAVRYFRQ
jgi:hypothetical protein